MATLILLNKPYLTLCQFSDRQGRATLADHVRVPDVYPAGRLDHDSEGLVLLTDDGTLQHRIASPNQKMEKTYLVQVEGSLSDEALERLSRGIELKDGPTRPARARRIEPPGLWPRVPPVRDRATIPTSWLELTLTEGRNRQVRRMTAAAGFPTLRLVRWRIGEWTLDGLAPGEYRTLTVHLPKAPPGAGRAGLRTQRPPGRRPKPNPSKRGSRV
ncbi:23S rRNA pseudouridine2457 synthase [Marinobacter daqiaonensis]|uniref:Pseudouridine synthase n=1 Tax=Marinobacter daqiaonensis TaxID=650891 RepID=A0A1I6H278_9GAMM|nr:pseudouridine synthase [Marinobacter daqiaonensis]SFR48512.1 23S rRNA pseudouridine2457 synthase [Marinobacter daqiaonensis]